MTSKYQILSYEWQKAHNTGYFYCLGEFSLMLGAGVGSFWRDYFCLTGNKPPQKFNILLIKFLNFLLAEIARSGHISEQRTANSKNFKIILFFVLCSLFAFKTVYPSLPLFLRLHFPPEILRFARKIHRRNLTALRFQ